MRRALIAALLVVAGCNGIPGGDDDDDDVDAAPPDADPYCHYDCFGYNACEDGVVTTWEHTPVPCEYWEGECPSYESYTCERGCRVDGVETSTYDEPSSVCEENRPKQAGDPCTEEAHCHPQVATVESDGTVINVYLTCDLEAGVCVDRDPPVIPDYFEPCDVHAPLPDDVPGSIQTGVLETDLCSGGACVYIEDSTESCIWQGCTAPCDSDDDCPVGTLCRHYHYRGDYCLPPIGADFDWTCVP